MIKFCIFDLDGTLFNTLTTITHYMNMTLTSNGIDPITEEECCSFIGHGARTLMKRALLSKEIDDEGYAARLLSEYNAAYNSDTLYLTKPYDGIVEMLSALKSRGIRLGVLSNKPDETTNIIISSFFDGIFDDVRGGREGVALKPSPEAVNMMIADSGFSPDEVMFIGDTKVDIETGLAAGVGASVGVSWGFRTREELLRAKATVIVDAPADIISEVTRRA